MKHKILNHVCNLLFYFLYLYKISINFCANGIVFKFAELFRLTLNTTNIKTPTIGTQGVGNTSIKNS